MTDEIAWLIERGDPPEYYTGNDFPSQYWTRDASQALRFARHEDGVTIANSGLIFDESDERRVVEHTWSGPRPKADPASVIEALKAEIAPREATGEMETAGAMQFAMRMQRITTAGDNAMLVYAAMLAASPYEKDN